MSDYDGLLFGLEYKDVNRIKLSVDKLIQSGDPYIFDRKFSLVVSTPIRKSATPPIKTYGDYSIREIADIVISNPGKLGYTVSHITYGELLKSIIP